MKKTNNLLLTLALIATLFAPAQARAVTVEESQTQATDKYPALARKGSALNLAFIDLYRKTKASDPSLLTNPRWPLILADMAYAAITLPRQAPVAQPDESEAMFAKSKAEAIRLYPDLAVKNSQLWTEAERLIKEYQEKSPAFFENPDAPVILAHKAALNVEAQKNGRIWITTKLNGIIIPKINFRDITLRDAVEFLNKKSKDLDPQNIGVNIILNFKEPAEEANPQGGIPGLAVTPSEPPAPYGGPDTRLTLTLDNAPLIDVIRYITNLSGLKYNVEEFRVLIAPPRAKYNPPSSFCFIDLWKSKK